MIDTIVIAQVYAAPFPEARIAVAVPGQAFVTSMADPLPLTFFITT